jgi:HEAT repeat protein
MRPDRPLLRLLAALLTAATALADDAGDDTKAPAAPAESKEAEDDKDTIETDPTIVDPAVKAIREEYDAIKGNQDIAQTRRRRELAQRLGRYRSAESLKILVSIIENDSDLRAVITAMDALARVGDLDAIKRMYRHVLKNSQKGVLPDYVGPALSHATDPGVGPWLVDKVLGHPNSFLNLSAVEAVGSLRTPEAREPLLKILAKVDRKTRPDMHLRYEVLRALGKIGGEGVRQVLFAAAADDDWRNRLAAAEILLVHFRDDEAQACMRKLLADDQPIVHETAAAAVGEAKMDTFAPDLARLMREGNLRVKQRSYEALKAVSGQDFGYAPEIWERWIKDKKAGELNAEGRPKAHLTVSTYYNYKIFSDRILFIVDVSGSMNWPDYSPNRIAVAKRELIKAIKALDEKSLFNIGTFAGHVSMWQKKGEVEATADNKEKALEWVEGALKARGGTNTWGALEDGFELNPRIDTIYFLSDGLPSAGKLEIPEEILIRLRYLNRFRKVIINTVAIAMGKPSIEKAEKYEDPDEMAAFLQMMADWNGGTCIDIRKPFLNLREDD